MDVSTGVLCGVIALFGWGTADFLARKAIDREGYFRVLFFSQAAGAVLLMVYALLFVEFKALSLEVLFLCVFMGMLWTFSYLAFYKAIEVGKLAVVSPVGASWAMIAALIGFAFFGEEITFVRGVGVMLTLSGIALSSTSFSELKKARKGFYLLSGINYALFAMFGWGIMFPVVDVVLPALGPLLPILYLKLLAVAYLLIVTPFTKKKLSLPAKNVAGLVLLIGLLDVIAFLGFTHGLETEFVSIVSPTAAAFPAVTVVLARVFLKETLEPNQKIGVLSIVMGLVLMALMS